MKRIRLGAGNKALVVLASLASGAGLVSGCIPTPDTSGLPPYDASVAQGFDSSVLNGFDAGEDAPSSEDAAQDAPATDAPAGSGSITGVVIDFAQGGGGAACCRGRR
jgi:hypothetical protein